MKHFAHVGKFAVASGSSEIRGELHRRLAELWIHHGDLRYANIHARKGIEITRGEADAEDTLGLNRAALELRWLEEGEAAALPDLIAHAHTARDQGYGYEHLLAAHSIVKVADDLGKSDVAAEWWARTEFLAESCGAEPLLERWRKERQERGYLPAHLDQLDASAAADTAKQDSYRIAQLVEELPKVDLAHHGIITRSKRLEEQGAWIGRLAPTKVPVLIHGESGTGKELFARLVHSLSTRTDGPFHAINCGAIPGDLLESELFGHRRGAFTGAVSDKAGLFQAANHGTLFLDEIGEMSSSAQTKLLRVIESGEYRRVGETRTESVDVRVVSATNVDLKKAVSENRFRKDLYYRLKGLEIFLPPLQDRLSDIPILAEYFLLQSNAQLGKDLVLPFETAQWLMGLPWKGNVRELKLAVERAASLASTSGPLMRYHFVVFEAEMQARSLPDELENIERERVVNALEASNWNQTAAAQLLGMSRTTLAGRIKRLGIVRPKDS
jgi:DNA-binding NtrC family response regulator